jgi:hypothetical protein
VKNKTKVEKKIWNILLATGQAKMSLNLTQKILIIKRKSYKADKSKNF